MPFWEKFKNLLSPKRNKQKEKKVAAMESFDIISWVETDSFTKWLAPEKSGNGKEELTLGKPVKGKEEDAKEGTQSDQQEAGGEAHRAPGGEDLAAKGRGSLAAEDPRPQEGGDPETATPPDEQPEPVSPEDHAPLPGHHAPHHHAHSHDGDATFQESFATAKMDTSNSVTADHEMSAMVVDCEEAFVTLPCVDMEDDPSSDSDIATVGMREETIPEERPSKEPEKAVVARNYLTGTRDIIVACVQLLYRAFIFPFTLPGLGCAAVKNRLPGKKNTK